MDVANYDQISVTNFRHNNRMNEIEIQVEYGRTVDGVWTPGIAPLNKQTHFLIRGADYVAMVGAHTPNEGEKTYAAARRALFDYLAAQNLIGPGSIV
jgi:hypothetical protein